MCRDCLPQGTLEVLGREIDGVRAELGEVYVREMVELIPAHHNCEIDGRTCLEREEASDLLVWQDPHAGESVLYSEEYRLVRDGARA